MQVKVSGETPFKVLKDKVAIGPTTNGYTIAYGVDGVNFTAYSEATPANENLIVTGLQQYMWLKLSGNTDTDVTVVL